jgi:hypothetical protein
MKPDDGPAGKRTAPTTSQGTISRRRIRLPGALLRMADTRSALRFTPSETVNPGATALTRIPSPPS